jgi:hypothetical protein
MTFKDPLDRRETPYETLGLTPEASPAEVQAALARFLRDRKNLPRLAIAQQALRTLKTPADRAAVDILLYSAEAPAAYPVEELYNDLGLDFAKEAQEIKPADGKRYDDLGVVDLTPEFDR